MTGDMVTVAGDMVTVAGKIVAMADSCVRVVAPVEQLVVVGRVDAERP